MKFSEGLHPDPPDLKEVVDELSPAQLFWVIKNGINMTGMPSFAAAGAKDEEIWSIVAFLKKLPNVSEADYRAWTASIRPRSRRKQVGRLHLADPGSGVADQGQPACEAGEHRPIPVTKIGGDAYGRKGENIEYGGSASAQHKGRSACRPVPAKPHSRMQASSQEPGTESGVGFKASCSQTNAANGHDLERHSPRVIDIGQPHREFWPERKFHMKAMRCRRYATG